MYAITYVQYTDISLDTLISLEILIKLNAQLKAFQTSFT